MKRACMTVAILALFFATPALAAKGFPTTLAGFTLGDQVDGYEKYCQMDRAVPVSDAPFLSEALVRSDALPGVRGGSLAFGNCENKGALIRIKLKFHDRGQGFFNKLYDRYTEDFGKPDRYLGDAFKNVIAWEWEFRNDKDEIVTLVLMWSRDNEIRPGVSIKMTHDSFMAREAECYKNENPVEEGKTRTRIQDLDAYVPR